MGPPTGITQAVYPVAQELKSRCSWPCCGATCSGARVHCTKHRAIGWRTISFAKVGTPAASTAIDRRRSAPPRWSASVRRLPVLVATDAARIDVEAPGVVNFDVPPRPRTHSRIGRTAGAEATGEAFTFASPQGDRKRRDRRRRPETPALTVPDFDDQQPQGQLEIPTPAHREIRARKAQGVTGAIPSPAAALPSRSDEARIETRR